MGNTHREKKERRQREKNTKREIEILQKNNPALPSDPSLSIRNSPCFLPPLYHRAGDATGGVLVFSVRATSPSEWRTEIAHLASLAPSLAGAESVGASFPNSVFDRRVRLTVLRAVGLAQVCSFSKPRYQCSSVSTKKDVGC